MSQYRFDPIRRIGVLYAPERADRPIRIGPGAVPQSEPGPGVSVSKLDRSGRAPFAPGFEQETPPEVLAIRPAGSITDDPAWSLRVVPNRYPFVARRSLGDGTRDDFGKRASEVAGFHEVVIETRDSTGDLAELDESATVDVVRAWMARLTVYRETPGIEWACVFRNSGPLSGASLPHPHSQLVGLPYVPPQVASVRTAMDASCRETGRCVVCREIEEAGERTVDESEWFVAECPRVSRFPYEQRIVARRHQASVFETAVDDAAVVDLARILSRRLRALKRVLPRLDYNLVLDAGPFPPTHSSDDGAAEHWCLEILPRTGGIAGFELVSGEWVNAVLPETAAKQFRAE